MTRRFSQMLMAFLFPNKAQGNAGELQQQRLTKTSMKHVNATATKRRTRSAEVKKENSERKIFEKQIETKMLNKIRSSFRICRQCSVD